MVSGARLICLIILTGVIVACGSRQPATGQPASLVAGRVSAGPVSPGARPGVPTTRPVRDATVEALRGNQVLATTHTDGSGRYQLRLQPGSYLIRAESSKYLSKEKSRTVTLASRQKVTVNFVLDTGIL